MASGDLALEVTNVYFGTAKETDPQRGNDSWEKRQELYGAGSAQPASQGYNAQTEVTIRKVVAGPVDFPDLFPMLDPSKQYVVKVFEQ